MARSNPLFACLNSLSPFAFSVSSFAFCAKVVAIT
jgi:hypothetical protein